MTQIEGQILIEDIIRDGQTFKFPLAHIQRELAMAILAQEEFFYLMGQASEKLKKKYMPMVSYVFQALLQLKFAERAETMDREEYIETMEEFIIQLSKIHITRVPKDSPDYEVIEVMSPL